ncbi:hypothetical protein BJX62DRAFT_159251 [Aspergillus germanicus]
MHPRPRSSNGPAGGVLDQKQEHLFTPCRLLLFYILVFLDFMTKSGIKCLWSVCFRFPVLWLMYRAGSAMLNWR